MSSIIENCYTEMLLFLITVIIVVTNYFRKSFQYWARKGVPFIKPRFPLGNSNTFLPKSISVGTITRNFYNELKKNGHKFGGVYLVTQPNLVIVDPEYLKDIMTKDFQHFVDRGIYYNAKDDPLSAHLFAVDGLEWKKMRVKLTPTFTSGKMRLMFQSVVECSNYMVEYIEQNLNNELDMKEILGRFSTDVIGSCAFGVTCNSFKHPNAEFRMMGKKIFDYGFWRSVKAFFMLNLPDLSRRLCIRATRSDVEDFFMKIVADTIKLRAENNINRNDFLQILIDMRDSTNFTMIEMASQVVLFFIAGFDTSSTAMTFALYELARNPDIQNKVRLEIEQVLERHSGNITYESLKEMTYLGQVLEETLRMYPPLTSLTRRCTKDYLLRDTDIVIEKGTPVLISTLGLHMDPEHFPNPEVFDPERFSEENKIRRHPFVYLPFGDGPRNCIGLRFGIMQSKIGIVSIIKNFGLTVSPLTKCVQLDPYVFLLKSVDNVYLHAEKLKI